MLVRSFGSSIRRHLSVYFALSARHYSSMDDDVRSLKQSLRKDMRGKLKAYTDSRLANESQLVWDRLHALPLYQEAKSIGLFLSMPSGEIRTDPAIAHACHLGKTLYVPRVGQDFEKADMDLIQVVIESDPSKGGDKDDLVHHSWPKNRWNIPEPPDDWPVATPGDIDLLIVPGLAFDRKGNRLGQGKGYYDRFIARMKPKALVAVGLSCQLIDTIIPTNEHDAPIATVVVPHHTILAAGRS